MQTPTCAYVKEKSFFGGDRGQGSPVPRIVEGKVETRESLFTLVQNPICVRVEERMFSRGDRSQVFLVAR